MLAPTTTAILITAAILHPRVCHLLRAIFPHAIMPLDAFILLKIAVQISARQIHAPLVIRARLPFVICSLVFAQILPWIAMITIRAPLIPVIILARLHIVPILLFHVLIHPAHPLCVILQLDIV